MLELACSRLIGYKPITHICALEGDHISVHAVGLLQYVNMHATRDSANLGRWVQTLVKPILNVSPAVLQYSACKTCYTAVASATPVRIGTVQRRLA